MGGEERESQLIRRVLQGDDSSFLELVLPYRERLLRRALSVTGNGEDAEDVVQETLLSAFRALGNFRHESSFYTWIFRILLNRCNDHLRKRSRSGGNLSEESLALIRDERINIEKNLELSESKRTLIEAINSLAERYRRPLLLRYFDGLSYHEIADVLKINEGTVKSRLFQARELLKRTLSAGNYGEESFGP